jgi:hypothetical protein
VLNTRGVAFITYTSEPQAQFAKEAMAHQGLDHAEVLNVRWATADPNPMAQKREARLIEEQAAEAVRRALPAEFVAEIEGRNPEARKRKKIEGGFGLEGYEAPDDVYFARGSNAVTAAGRHGMERLTEGELTLEDEQRLMIEAGDMQLPGDENVYGAPADSGGIFSSSTLAALKGAQGQFAQRPTKEKSSGPLVAYGSDSDDDE